MLERHPKQEENSSREPTAAATFPQLEPGERPAPIAILSAAKRAALIAFLHGDGVLHKSRGVWTGFPARASGARIYGMTIADLARDGILTVTMIGKSASARLTPRGSWFARTLAAEFAAFNGNLTCDLVGHRSGNVPSLTGGANATSGASKAST